MRFCELNRRSAEIMKISPGLHLSASSDLNSRFEREFKHTILPPQALIRSLQAKKGSARSEIESNKKCAQGLSLSALTADKARSCNDANERGLKLPEPQQGVSFKKSKSDEDSSLKSSSDLKLKSINNDLVNAG